jgi:site-specific recombinase XerD
MRRLCEKADVPYEPPHKLRHCHAVYALKQAQDVADLKAVSQNLMHASLITRASIYSVLTENDVGDRVSSLGKNGSQSNTLQELTPAQLDQLRELLAGAL